jgi:hypothetical protein
MIWRDMDLKTKSYEFRRGQWWSVWRKLSMQSSGQTEWNPRENTFLLASSQPFLFWFCSRLMNKKLESVWMESVVVQFMISLLYLPGKIEGNHENPQWGWPVSWPRFEPGTSWIQLTLFGRNLISKHPLKTESSIILLPKELFDQVVSNF